MPCTDGEEQDGGRFTDPLVQRQREELLYWRSRLDDIADGWYRTVVSVLGAIVALLALAGATNAALAGTGLILGVPLLLVYINVTSDAGWQAWRNVEWLNAALPTTDRVWGEVEARPYERPPGAWAACIVMMLLIVPADAVAVTVLPTVWSEQQFWQDLKINLDGLSLWLGITIVSVLGILKLGLASLILGRELRGHPNSQGADVKSSTEGASGSEE